MVAVLFRKENEWAEDFVRRSQAQHDEYSPGCKGRALQFRGVAIPAITGDRILFEPIHEKPER
jgi:hypothetical protein